MFAPHARSGCRVEGPQIHSDSVLNKYNKLKTTLISIFKKIKFSIWYIQWKHWLCANLRWNHINICASCTGLCHFFFFVKEGCVSATDEWSRSKHPFPLSTWGVSITPDVRWVGVAAPHILAAPLLMKDSGWTQVTCCRLAAPRALQGPLKSVSSVGDTQQTPERIKTLTAAM